MPSLSLFAVCQKVIVDRNDNTVSLIGLISGLAVTPPANGIPADASAYANWAALSLMRCEPEDDGKTFEQRIRIVAPNGEEKGEASLVFQFSESKHHNLFNANAFPVGQIGAYRVILSQREVGTENGWQDIGEYRIDVEYRGEE